MNKICTNVSQSQKLIELGIDVNTAEFQIKYVHELQHALILCGINKEIEL